MLLKLQAEWGSASPLRAAVSVSAPLRLEVCAERINQGFSRVYQRYLLNSLIGKVLGKFDRHDYETLIGLTPSRIGQARSFREFDQYFTAPIHGFADADDYYQRASAYHRLGEIQRPALIIQALDDPFMTPQVLPPAQQLSEQITLAVSRHGGHVGFMSGTIVKPSCWLPVAVTNYLAQYV